MNINKDTFLKIFLPLVSVLKPKYVDESFSQVNKNIYYHALKHFDEEVLGKAIINIVNSEKSLAYGFPTIALIKEYCKEAQRPSIKQKTLLLIIEIRSKGKYNKPKKIKDIFLNDFVEKYGWEYLCNLSENEIYELSDKFLVERCFLNEEVSISNTLKNEKKEQNRIEK